MGPNSIVGGWAVTSFGDIFRDSVVSGHLAEGLAVC